MDQDSRIADLEAKVAELTSLLHGGQEPAASETIDDEAPKASRRGMIKLAGAVAAGAVASTVVGTKAAATTDEALVTGHLNNATQQTAIRYGGGVNGAPGNNLGPFLGGTSSSPMFLVDATGSPSATAAGASISANGTGLTVQGEIGIVAVGGDSPAFWGLGGNYSLNSGPTDKANLYLQPNNNFLFSTSPKVPVLERTDAHLVGEIDNVAGDLWMCVASGTPGTWRKITGPSAAGSLHLLAAPKRVYDSRPTEEPVLVAPKTVLAPGTPRTIDTTANSSGVPAAATGVLLNVGVVTASGAGFLSVTPGGAGFTGTSSLNWNGASIAIANGITVGTGAGATIDLYAGAGATDVFVDVFGYYI